MCLFYRNIDERMDSIKAIEKATETRLKHINRKLDHQKKVERLANKNSNKKAVANSMSKTIGKLFEDMDKMKAKAKTRANKRKVKKFKFNEGTNQQEKNGEKTKDESMSLMDALFSAIEKGNEKRNAKRQIKSSQEEDGKLSRSDEEKSLEQEMNDVKKKDLKVWLFIPKFYLFIWLSQSNP